MLSFFKPQELLFSQNIISFLVLHPRLCHIIKKFGINDCYFCDNFTVAPYVVNKLVIPIDNDSEGVENVGNSIFHRLGLLPLTKSIAIGEHSRYCLIEQYEDVYLVVFNEPSAVRDGYPFPRIILQNYRVGGRLTRELKAYASLMRRCNG